MEPDNIQIIRDSLSTLEYEECLLFGSRARGDARSDSDYDLLVILKGSPSSRKKMQIAASLRQRLADKWINADVVVKSKDEIRYYRDKPGSIVRNALAEAVSL